MVALRNARKQYRLKTPKERFKKGDRIRAFAGKHDGRVGTVKKVNDHRLTMSWDDGNDRRTTYVDASMAELLSDWQEAQASAPPEPRIATRTRATATGSGQPETTQEGVREWTYDKVEKELEHLTVQLVAMLRMCDDPNVAWKEAKARVDAMLVWHRES